MDDEACLKHLKGDATPHYIFGYEHTSKNLFKQIGTASKNSKKPKLVKPDEGVSAESVLLKGGNVFDKSQIIHFGSLDEIKLHLGNGKLNTENVAVNMLDG